MFLFVETMSCIHPPLVELSGFLGVTFEKRVYEKSNRSFFYVVNKYVVSVGSLKPPSRHSMSNQIWCELNQAWTRSGMSSQDRPSFVGSGVSVLDTYNKVCFGRLRPVSGQTSSDLFKDERYSRAGFGVTRGAPHLSYQSFRCWCLRRRPVVVSSRVLSLRADSVSLVCMLRVRS